MSTKKSGISPEDALREMVRTYISPLIRTYIGDYKWSPDDITRVIASELGKAFAEGIVDALKKSR